MRVFGIDLEICESIVFGSSLRHRHCDKVYLKYISNQRLFRSLDNRYNEGNQELTKTNFKMRIQFQLEA